MSALIQDSFFVIDTENIGTVNTKLYGYCVASDAEHLFKENDETSQCINALNPEDFPDGAYVLVQNTENEIRISQDFNGAFGLYLYENNDYFAISNSFVLLVEYLKQRFPLTIDYDYTNTYFLTGLVAMAYSETMVKEIRCLPRDVRIIINKENKKINFESIDYEENTVSIDSQDGVNLLDQWYNKWISIIRYIKKSTNAITVDLSGGMDSRMVLLLFLQSGIDLNTIRINSINDGLHTHNEDYEIASTIAKEFNFELNRAEERMVVPLTISDSINIISYVRLCFCTEINSRLEFNKKPTFEFKGSGGETLRKHWDISPVEYIKDINQRRGRYNTTDFGSSVDKIFEHAFCAARKKYNIADANSSDITNGFYRETRCRNHFGKEIALNSICNNYQMAPLLDFALAKISLKGCRTANRNLILATIFDRYCPKLLNFKFDSNRSIEKTILEYAHEINSKYSFNEKAKPVEGKWFLYGNLAYNMPHSVVPVSETQINSLFLDSFLSEKTYRLFTKHFSKEIYDDALRFSQKVLYHPEARYIPILGVVKILSDITDKSNIGFTPFEFFKSLLTDDRYYHNLFNYTLQTARIDIKNYSDENNDSDIRINLNENRDCLLEKPKWFHKNGIGYVITTSHNEGIDIKITCLNDGLLLLVLRSIDIRDKNKQRINYFVDYTKLIVDNQIKFDYIMPCSHDKPFRYTFPVRAGQCTVIHLEWRKHDYNISDYFKIVSLIAESFLDAKETARRNKKEKELLEQFEKIKKEKKQIQQNALGLEQEKTKIAKQLEETQQKAAVLEQEKVETTKRLEETQQKAAVLEQEKVETTKRLEETQSKNRKLADELYNVKNGFSFRTGRVITWIPRKIKDFFK